MSNLAPFVDDYKKDIVNFLNKTIDGTDDGKLEFELRFGSFSKKKFVPGIKIDDFISLENSGVIGTFFNKSISVDSNYSDGTRKTDYLDEAFNIVKKVWIKKEKFPYSIDNTEYNYRVSLAKESEIPDPKNKLNPSMFRKKRRSTFQKEMFKVDMTRVKMAKTLEELNKSSPIDSIYEVEIEYIPDFTDRALHPSIEHSYAILTELVGNILRLLNKSFFIVPESEKQKVMIKYNSLMNNQKGSQPFTATRENLKYIKSNEYSVTEKADGLRGMMFINSDGKVYIITKTSITLTNLTNDVNKNTIFDGEYLNYTEVSTNVNSNLFLVFDIAFIDGVKTTLKSHIERMKSIKLILNSFERLPNTNESFMNTQVKLKNFLTKGSIIENSNFILEYYNDPNSDYKIDGLVFTPLNTEYLFKTPKDPKKITYKWKPQGQNTIDFHIQIIEPKVSIKGVNYVVCHLRVSTTSDDRKLISSRTNYVSENIETIYNNVNVKLFQPEDNPEVFETFISSDYNFELYDRTIVECAYLFDNFLNSFNFIPINTRWDKTISKKGPNFVTTANDVWEVIKNPILIEELGMDYFSKKEMKEKGKEKINKPSPRPKSPPMRPDILTRDQRKKSKVINMRLYHNFIKNFLIKKYGKVRYILDLASGKGGDLFKYPKGVNLLGFDIDPVSVSESRRRAIERNIYDKESIFNYFVLDLSKNSIGSVITHELSRIENTIFDMVNCQFALHHFYKDKATLDNFLQNVSTSLIADGYFIGTCFDGEKVFKLLDGKDKYKTDTFTIEKEYNKTNKDFDTLPEFGQAINVTLSTDTVVSVETKEYLVNFNKLVKYMRDNFDLDLVSLKSFKKLYKAWDGAKLSEDEKTFSFLNNFFVFKKLPRLKNSKSVTQGPRPIPTSAPSAPSAPSTPSTSEEVNDNLTKLKRRELVEVAKNMSPPVKHTGVNMKNLRKAIRAARG